MWTNDKYDWFWIDPRCGQQLNKTVGFGLIVGENIVVGGFIIGLIVKVNIVDLELIHVVTQRWINKDCIRLTVVLIVCFKISNVWKTKHKQKNTNKKNKGKMLMICLNSFVFK